MVKFTSNNSPSDSDERDAIFCECLVKQRAQKEDHVTYKEGLDAMLVITETLCAFLHKTF